MRTTGNRSHPIDVGMIWDKCIRRPNGCFEWQGAKNKKGYGNIRFCGKTRTVSRVVMHLVHDLDIDDPEIFVLHHCDNPKCLNLKHLYLGSAKDNMRDMHKRKRWKKGKHAPK